MEISLTFILDIPEIEGGPHPVSVAGDIVTDVEQLVLEYYVNGEKLLDGHEVITKVVTHD